MEVPHHTGITYEKAIDEVKESLKDDIVEGHDIKSINLMRECCVSILVQWHTLSMTEQLTSA